MTCCCLFCVTGGVAGVQTGQDTSASIALLCLKCLCLCAAGSHCTETMSSLECSPVDGHQAKCHEIQDLCANDGICYACQARHGLACGMPDAKAEASKCKSARMSHLCAR